MTQGLALFLSLLIETTAVCAILAPRGWLLPGRRGRLLAAAFAATLLSHPFAWAAFGTLRPILPSYWARAAIIEIAVALFEAALYARLLPLAWPRALLLSFLANGLSFGLGLWISAALGP